jgi:hypothetical protein
MLIHFRGHLKNSCESQDNSCFIVYRRLIKKIDIVPASRLDGMYASLKELENKDVGPCGGFSTMYNFMCDYHNLIQREEVTWVRPLFISSQHLAVPSAKHGRIF